MATAPEQIFKAYDVRGLYGDDIDADIADCWAAHSSVSSPTSRAGPRAICAWASAATCASLRRSSPSATSTAW